jgi:hypothetical protein
MRSLQGYERWIGLVKLTSSVDLGDLRHDAGKRRLGDTTLNAEASDYLAITLEQHAGIP